VHGVANINFPLFDYQRQDTWLRNYTSYARLGLEICWCQL